MQAEPNAKIDSEYNVPLNGKKRSCMSYKYKKEGDELVGNVESKSKSIPWCIVYVPLKRLKFCRVQMVREKCDKKEFFMIRM